MSEKVINIMTYEQQQSLKELIHTLTTVHLDKNKQYLMTTHTSEGSYNQYVNREEYLEFHLSVALETLGETFPGLEE